MEINFQKMLNSNPKKTDSLCVNHNLTISESLNTAFLEKAFQNLQALSGLIWGFHPPEWQKLTFLGVNFHRLIQS